MMSVLLSLLRTCKHRRDRAPRFTSKSWRYGTNCMCCSAPAAAAAARDGGPVVPAEKSVLVAAVDVAPAMDTLRGDDVGARLAPHDPPNMAAVAGALHQLEVPKTAPTASASNGHGLDGWA
jgi:hypothetical protein